MMHDITIVPYEPTLAPAFASLNVAWIEQYFRLEEADMKVLGDPGASIIAKGGQIFFALDHGVAVGTAAALRVSPTTFELAKMAVTPSHQGRGLAELLGRAVIEFATAAGAELLFLETNDALSTAIRLYERLGFRTVVPPRQSPYARSNVYMELRLPGGPGAPTADGADDAGG